VKDRIDRKSGDALSKISIPVLILQGKEDDPVSLSTAANIDKALADSGNNSHTLNYFSYLGKFFGKRVNDGIHRIYYLTDNSVLEKITEWLKNNTSKPAAAPSEPAAQVK
jgi:hypothetical protein